MLRHWLTLCFFIGTTAIVQGQTCTNPGQVPLASFPVCGASVFVQTVVPACSGTPVPTACTTGGIVYRDKNPYWYKFTCYTSGTLGFVITPRNLSDDYDWQLFDITGHAPADVYTDPGLFVSCNWSGETGVTGASSSGTSSVNCAGFGIPTFNVMPATIAGHTYLLMVSHFDDGSQSGYSLQFTGGSAGITDTATSNLVSAVASCSGNTIGVKLNKKLKCSSLAANGSDFGLSAPGVQIIQAASANCTTGFDTDSIVLTLNNPLPVGTHTITSKTGTDSNTMLDYCNVQMAVGLVATFVATPTLPVTIDSIKRVGCRPNQLTVILKGLINCASVAPDGSDFIITGPAPVSIDSAIVSCIGNATGKIILRLTSPIFNGGNYQLSVVQGSDGNTLENVCQVNTPVGDTKAFMVADTVDAQFSYIITQSCKGDTVRVIPNATSINMWNWTIGTSGYIGPNPVWVFTTSGSHNIRLIVSNGTCSDTITKNIVVNPIPPLTTSILVNDVKCFGQKNGNLTAVTTGGLGSYTYQWVNGTNTFSGNPLLNADTGKYVLTVTDSMGCTATATARVKEPSLLKHTAKMTNTNCGLSDGTAMVTPGGGTLPYAYTWLPNGGNNASATGLAAGNYVINITDKNGCLDTGHIFIGPSIGVSSTLVTKSNSCQTSNTGSATISSTGFGTMAYSWAPYGGNAATANNLGAGNYIVTATDSKGCKDTVQVSIGLATQIIITANQTNVSCYNNKDGKVIISAGGAGPFTYKWTPAITIGNVATGLAIGSYSVTVTDTIGCSLDKIITITQPDLLQLQVKSQNTTCGLNNGKAEALPTGGTKPYQYVWSSGNRNQQVRDLSPVTLSVAVTDSNGCTASHYGITIVSSRAISATLGADIDLCPGDSIRLYPGNYFSYTWQDGSVLPVYSVTHAGLYTVTVKDDTGCIATAMVRVNPVCKDILFPDAFTPNNDKRNDEFGPLGTLQSVKDYSLKIFDRWGNTVFASANPYIKWDGKINNANAPNGTYIWIAEYTFNGKPKKIKKGTIVIIR